MKIATADICCLCIVLLLCGGCALFGDYRTQRFEVGAGRELLLRVPRGLGQKSLTTDSAGNRHLLLRYPWGAELYLSTDTGLSAFIDTSRHLPRPHLWGGRFYKGVLKGPSFWREVYSQGLKYGYRNVGREDEPLFDSALNSLRQHP